MDHAQRGYEMGTSPEGGGVGSDEMTEAEFDRMIAEVRACRRHAVDEYLREAERLRRHAAELEANAQILEGQIWRRAAEACDRGAARELETLQ